MPTTSATHPCMSYGGMESRHWRFSNVIESEVTTEHLYGTRAQLRKIQLPSRCSTFSDLHGGPFLTIFGFPMPLARSRVTPFWAVLFLLFSSFRPCHFFAFLRRLLERASVGAPCQHCIQRFSTCRLGVISLVIFAGVPFRRTGDGFLLEGSCQPMSVLQFRPRCLVLDRLCLQRGSSGPCRIAVTSVS